MEKDIQHIIAGCINNNMLMQKELYFLYYEEMVRVCMRYTNDYETSATLYNDAMLKVFKSIADYKHEGKTFAWIKRIVINTCLDRLRLKTPMLTIDIQTASEDEYAIDESVLDNMSATEIRKLINQLPGHLAIVFNLYVYEEYTHPEISKLLKIPVGTSRYHLSEARRLLKSKIDNQIYHTVQSN